MCVLLLIYNIYIYTYPHTCVSVCVCVRCFIVYRMRWPSYGCAIETILRGSAGDFNGARIVGIAVLILGGAMGV